MFTTTRIRSIDVQAKLFRGFADSSRLTILEALRDGPRTVTELVEATDLTQSNASNHLCCLRDCGLVTTKQDGRFIYYQLSDQRIERLLRLADDLLAEVAQGVQQCARDNTPKESRHAKN